MKSFDQYLDIQYPDNKTLDMRLSEGVEWTTHCCTVLGAMPEGVVASAGKLAEFHGVPAAYLGKQMQRLAAAGIVESVPGRRGGFRLARSTDQITLLDIVLAVEGDEPAFRCTEIRQAGPSAVPAARYVRPCGIAAAMWSAEQAWRDALGSTTIADLLADLEVDPEQSERAVEWWIEVLP